MASEKIPLLELRGVNKTFNGVVRALIDVNICLYPGEILGIVGENGAGKSTLMKILAGVLPPDGGEMYFFGTKVPFPRNPRESASRGIALVPQEKGVIPHLKVYQFLMLGNEDCFSSFGRLKIGEMRKTAEKILSELNIECDTNTYMYELPLPVQKLVEIAKAILTIRVRCKDTRITPVVILDEPTAPLAVEHRKHLFEFMTNSKEKISFVFVSHIIPEILGFADRIYVLRDGRVVASHNLREEKLSEEDIFREIVGRSSSEFLKRRESVTRETPWRVLLSVRNLSKRGSYYNVSFDLHEGECLGLFGTAGSGKAEIIKTLAGIMDFDEGEVVFDGRPLKKGEPPYARLKRGIGYFSGETGKELFLNWSIARNLSILNLEKVIGLGGVILNSKKEEEIAEKVMKTLKIKAPSPRTECYSLSGGNKQKVSVGKWMERKPRLLLLEDPTIGIDVGAREDIYEALLEMKKNGISMVLVSDDPKEYVLLCDRILYIKGGRIEKTVTPEELEKILREE